MKVASLSTHVIYSISCVIVTLVLFDMPVNMKPVYLLACDHWCVMTTGVCQWSQHVWWDTCKHGGQPYLFVCDTALSGCIMFIFVLNVDYLSHNYRVFIKLQMFFSHDNMDWISYFIIKTCFCVKLVFDWVCVLYTKIWLRNNASWFETRSWYQWLVSPVVVVFNINYPVCLL